MANGRNIQRVAVEFDRMIEEAGVTMDTFFFEFVQDFSEIAIRRTPVDTGFMRASWFLSNSDAVSARGPAENAVNPGASGASASLSAISADLLGARGTFQDHDIFFLNGAEYAMVVNARTQFFDEVIALAPSIAQDTATRIAAIAK